MPDIYQKLAGRLYTLRKERGLTQVQAAKRSGIGSKTLSTFETGAKIKKMTLAQLHALCEAYGITPAQLFT